MQFYCIGGSVSQPVSIWCDHQLPHVVQHTSFAFRIDQVVDCGLCNVVALFHCMVRYGSARYGTAQFGSVAFPPQFSTAIEWAGLFTRRYNCAASTAVTSS